MSRGVAFICTLAVGGLVAVQPAANAALAERVSDVGAALVSIVISLVLILAVLLIFGHPSRLSGLSHGFKFEYALGGIGGAAVVTIGLITVRTLGAGGVIALLVAAQLVVSVLVDRFGWFGVQVVGLSTGRLIGVALVIAGTVLVTRT